MIFESDYDTTLPSDGDIEEQEEWVLINNIGKSLPGVPGRIISCFNASANLCTCLIELARGFFFWGFILTIYLHSEYLGQDCSNDLCCPTHSSSIR